MAPKVYKDKEDGHISDYFSKDNLHTNKEAKVGSVDPEKEGKSKDSAEWFIDEHPPDESVREIFVKPGSSDDADLVSSAS